jgi:hypothetical protein
VANRQKILRRREVLLVEIERHCQNTGCNAINRIGLTKQEALAYFGYECERCERWNADSLARKDVPEWWDEIIPSDGV